MHAKTLTIDGQVVFMGSSNMDIRSFDLNYENDVLVQDQKITQAVCKRQNEYISCSDSVTLEDVVGWSVRERPVSPA
ncbi:phospholipase D-like domain-containing protein [Profundibacter sp.]